MDPMEFDDELKARFGERVQARMNDLDLIAEDMIGSGPLKLSDKRLRWTLRGTGPTPRDSTFGKLEHLLKLETDTAKQSFRNDADLQPDHAVDRSTSPYPPQTYTADEVAQLRQLEKILWRMGIEKGEFFKPSGEPGYAMSVDVAAEFIQRANELLDLVRANQPLDRTPPSGAPE